MKRVPLSGKRAAGAVALVDAADYEDVMAAGPWHMGVNNYPIRHIPHPAGGRNFNARGSRRTTQKLHQFLFGSRMDHIDRNPLNNQRGNLRPATQGQNNQNRGSYKGSASQYRGVTWDSARGKWRAQAMIGGKQHHLGMFKDEDEAGRAAAEFRRNHMPFSAEALGEKAS